MALGPSFLVVAAARGLPTHLLASPRTSAKPLSNPELVQQSLRQFPARQSMLARQPTCQLSTPPQARVLVPRACRAYFQHTAHSPQSRTASPRLRSSLRTNAGPPIQPTRARSTHSRIHPRLHHPMPLRAVRLFCLGQGARRRMGVTDVIYDVVSEPDMQKLGCELLAANGTLVLTLPSGLGGKKVKSTLESPFPPSNEHVGEDLYASLHGYLDTGAIQLCPPWSGAALYYYI
ncbi:hypothetical protein FIBSPDRAFT_890806 [Athelia psychrophila]|uniref:Uncharacterized protein n=1 Tax=Athelia psychrophila TaxID=1759441 RepID=A0A166KL39_9AGAM|nr:hypothetical protein FIBSPDRAFT_890806 [Fibularhizoctonia sp. CBS 109695]